MSEMMHYGIKRQSGRYPWGSGGDDYQRSMDFYAFVDDLKAKGIPDKDIAKLIGAEVQAKSNDPRAKFTMNDLRSTRTIAKEVIVQEETHRAIKLRDKGVSIKAISEELGIPTPTVRLRLKNSENLKQSTLRKTADVIKDAVDTHQIVDIGKGTNLNIDVSDISLKGVSPEKLRAAVSLLRDEGYETYSLKTRQVGTDQFTNRMVVVPPGTTFKGANSMKDNIYTMGKWTEDDGKTFLGIHEPMSINSKRLKVLYDEDGGSAQDGVVYVRPGVKDLDMGKNTYAQVRIAIDGTHFIKGMAVLKHDMPDGVDLLFNTNKSKNDPKIKSEGKLGALKPLKDDPDNPFGSIIKRQIVDIDPKTGKERLKSAMNLVNEPGDWDDWRKSIPSQMLSKQPHSLIKSQLDKTRSDVKARLDEIDKITNPVVRRLELEKFAERIDSDAVDLRAAAMPHQHTRVIIPMPKMNKTEIYAPDYESGERVVLIRYPHGGRFEIPEVTVNNNNRTAKRVLGNAKDAIGIHPAVAQRLSGADFDGDTVVVIPNRSGVIKGVQSMGSQARIYEDGLRNFEPKRQYGGYNEDKPNFKIMGNTGKEMGVITNLITDMSIQGAKPDHILRAVKHSMVVIDAEKHKLDYKKSEQDNGIAQLKQLYQSTKQPDGSTKVGGASTLLSKATAKKRIPEQQLRRQREGGPIDEQGRLVYVPTGRTRSKYDPKTQTYDPNVRVPIEKEVKRLRLTDDAYTLVRDKADPVERLYADHANDMKSMANTARLRASRIANPKMNPRAKEVYKGEVSKLVQDLREIQKLAPLDRRAQTYANTVVKAKHKEDPTLRTDSDRRKKVERQALAHGRARLGLKKEMYEIDISDTQWDAIQSGAVSASMLRDIIARANPDRVRELAIPRANTVMSSAMQARARAMLATGATNADVARALGIPASTLRSAAVRGDV